MIIDIAIPGDARVKDKELEKIEKYQLLREEIRKVMEAEENDCGASCDQSNRGCI